MRHFRHPGMGQESRWVRATRRVEKADSSFLPRPFSLLYALLLFYIIRRQTQHEKDEEIANYYIRYCKASLLVYIHATRRKRQKARRRKKLKRDLLEAGVQVHECRKCGSKKHLSGLYTRVSEEGRVEYICQTCPTRGKRRSKKRESKKSNTRQEGSSVNQYRRVLSLGDEELTRDKIKRAYREEVKKAHPDQGGSREKFKQVKEAKEELMKRVSSNPV
jgi:hypothetical protein